MWTMNRLVNDNIPALQGSISGPDDGSIVALAIVNTILGASTGGLAVLFINKFLFAKVGDKLLDNIIRIFYCSPGVS